MSDDVLRQRREQQPNELRKRRIEPVRRGCTQARYKSVEGRWITIVHQRDIGIITMHLGRRNFRPNGQKPTHTASPMTGIANFGMFLLLESLTNCFVTVV